MYLFKSGFALYGIDMNNLDIYAVVVAGKLDATEIIINVTTTLCSLLQSY